MVGRGLAWGDEKMTNICFYISDYGYGHASRDIAIIRKILNENKDVKMFVKTGGPFHFVRQSLPQKNVEVIQTRNDIGVVFKENSVIVDIERTKEMLDAWIASWDVYIQSERVFCETHRIDLILSDIVPQPFIVADELNIPGIAISNFTWYYIFYNLFGEVAATERIKEAYECADIALVLPFNEEMNIFRKKKAINLVSREITMNRYDMRKKCGVSDDELLVHVGVGKSLNPSFMRNMKPIEAPDVKFLVSSNADLPFKNVIRIPNNDTETQNYIGMCDLVVSKTGYGTVSEAVRAEIPMFLLKREGFTEDELIGGKIEEMGIGKFISEESFLDGVWVNEFHHLDIYTRGFNNLNGRFKKDGAVEIFEAIKEMDKHDILEK
ncbi:hypothetical protein M1O54_06865 [Dehalococcoidia bacterium]|nr:hypothetical protein [Dehalococcoidia bacterium]